MNLVTDRTLNDVITGTAKGQYTAEDLNRVEQAVAELYGAACALGIYPPGYFKTDWDSQAVFSPQSWPTQNQMHRYLANIRHLCEGVELAEGLPSTMEKLTWERANRIEEALLLVYPRIGSAVQNFQYSGEIFAGEEL